MDQIPERDWDRLSPEARSTLAMLAGLREGRTISELSARLSEAVDGVIEMMTESDQGKVSGPAATVTLTLRVSPQDKRGDIVMVSEEVKARVPQDRSHPLYVGKGSTLHTRQATTTMLFGVTADGNGRVAFEAADHDGDGTRLPYKD